LLMNRNEATETKTFLFDYKDETQFNNAIAMLSDAIITGYTGSETDLPIPDKTIPKSKVMIAEEGAFIKEILGFRKINTFDQYQFTLKDDSIFTTVLTEASAQRIFLGDFLHFDGNEICVINKSLIQ